MFLLCELLPTKDYSIIYQTLLSSEHKNELLSVPTNHVNHTEERGNNIAASLFAFELSLNIHPLCPRSLQFRPVFMCNLSEFSVYIAAVSLCEEDAARFAS